MGVVAKAAHAYSCGLVDGKKHRAPGRGVADPSRRASAADSAVASEIMTEFECTFNLQQDTVEVIAAMKADPPSYERFGKLARPSPMEALDAEAAGDFITTIREPPVAHQPFAAMPTTSTSDVRPRGTFGDAPFMTAQTELKFCCVEAEQQYVTSMGMDRVIRHAEGTALLNRNGVLVAARASSTLEPNVSRELLRVYWEMEKHRPFLQRGKAVANVCCNFVVSGTKSQNNTKLLAAHVTETVQEVAMRGKLVGLFRKHVWPKVAHEFGWLFNPVAKFITDHDIPTWLYQVTGVTGGRLFWPRHHVDPDFWYTILIPLDYGRGLRGGGDFAFGGVGHVLGCRHGDILVYNGLELHGTTEFDPVGESDGRIFFAFYAKKQVLDAGIRSRALMQRLGPQPLHV